MKTRSRSPSPRRSKHRRHRSGSHSRSSSPAQAKMKELNVTDDSPSSTMTKAESESTGRPAEGSSGQLCAPGEKGKDTGDSGLWWPDESCCCHRSHSQLLCLLLNTSTSLYVFSEENIQFLAPFFSGTAFWFAQKAYFALSCFIKLCTLSVFFLFYYYYLWTFTLSCVSSIFVRSQVWTVQGADTLGNTQGFMVM